MHSGAFDGAIRNTTPVLCKCTVLIYTCPMPWDTHITLMPYVISHMRQRRCSCPSRPWKQIGSAAISCIANYCNTWWLSENHLILFIILWVRNLGRAHVSSVWLRQVLGQLVLEGPFPWWLLHSHVWVLLLHGLSPMTSYLIVPPSWTKRGNELKLRKKRKWFFILSKEYE